MTKAIFDIVAESAVENNDKRIYQLLFSSKTGKKKIRQSIRKGEIKGKIEGKIETARNMQKDGLPLATIAKYTGFSVEELARLLEQENQ